MCLSALKDKAFGGMPELIRDSLLSARTLFDLSISNGEPIEKAPSDADLSLLLPFSGHKPPDAGLNPTAPEVRRPTKKTEGRLATTNFLRKLVILPCLGGRKHQQVPVLSLALEGLYFKKEVLVLWSF